MMEFLRAYLSVLRTTLAAVLFVVVILALAFTPIILFDTGHTTEGIVFTVFLVLGGIGFIALGEME